MLRPIWFDAALKNFIFEVSPKNAFSHSQGHFPPLPHCNAADRFTSINRH
jgi:hypothetical protein